MFPDIGLSDCIAPPCRRDELEYRLANAILGDRHGFHVFRLERKIPARDPDLEGAREVIRAELEQRQLEELRPAWLRELRAQATIRVNEPVLEEIE